MLISCRLQFYSVDVNAVSHKLVARAGVTVSCSKLSLYVHFSFGISILCASSLILFHPNIMVFDLLLNCFAGGAGNHFITSE